MSNNKVGKFYEENRDKYLEDLVSTGIPLDQAEDILQSSFTKFLGVFERVITENLFKEVLLEELREKDQKDKANLFVRLREDRVAGGVSDDV